ncbi:MAG: asparaginase [Bacteroidia bacterium]
MCNPILVEVERAGVLESFHRGSICIVDDNNEIVFSMGDIEQICYPRSAMKLIQVIPLLENGAQEHFGFTLEEIALMCGSHNAEKEHIRVLNQILEKINCSYADLLCGAQYPTYKPESDEFIRLQIKPGQEHNNCSGKHAGMLAACKLFGFDTKDYIHPEHPLQKMIVEVVADFYEYPVSKMVCALDGCSAPIYSIPVKNQAIAYKNLCGQARFHTKRNQACKTIIEAVSQYPFMVAGSKRYCSDMMKITAPKVIGKTGAEGIFCMSFTEQKWGVCIKIDDGKMQPQYNIAQAIISECGLFSEEEIKSLKSYQETELKNFNKFTTGAIKSIHLNLPKATQVH